MTELHRGKLAKRPKILSVRPLTREDMACLTEKRPAQGRPKILREAHHRLARLVASGLPVQEILRATGYSSTRYVQLKDSPAFQELIAQYRNKVDEAWLANIDEFYETSTSNMLRAERQIERHLDLADEADELIPLKTLTSITSDRADRFGYPKHAHNRTEVFDFARMMEAAATQLGKATTIDARANPSHSGPSLAPSGKEVSVTPAPSLPSRNSQPAAVPAGIRRRA